MKDRLLKFLNKEQLSSARFAEIIGVQPSSVSHILSGRNKPGFDFIQKILGNYPLINAEWLIMGKGSMFKNEGFQGNLFHADPKENDNISANEPTDSDINKKKPENDYFSEVERDFADTNVNKKEQERDYKSEYFRAERVTNVTKDKFVEKIVIFYTDKSFSEYSPE